LLQCYNMETARKWTMTEVQGFAKWDADRKSGKLGTPMHFETVEELESWLHDKK